MKGWVISSSLSARPGDSTPWYASFWEFCARYCDERFGNEWHLSPEQSILLYAENTVIPTQVVVYSPKATNHTTELPFWHVDVRLETGRYAVGPVGKGTGCVCFPRRRHS